MNHKKNVETPDDAGRPSRDKCPPPRGEKQKKKGQISALSLFDCNGSTECSITYEKKNYPFLNDYYADKTFSKGEKIECYYGKTGSCGMVSLHITKTTKGLGCTIAGKAKDKEIGFDLVWKKTAEDFKPTFASYNFSKTKAEEHHLLLKGWEEKDLKTSLLNITFGSALST